MPQEGRKALEIDMASQQPAFKVKNQTLAPQGRLKIEWAESRMPVLMKLRAEAERTKPLKGQRIAGCLHVTKETAVLIRTLKAAGAEISWSGCNPLSTQDDISAALADEVSIFAWHGMTRDEFFWAIDRTLDFKPTLTLDDGADLIFTVHSRFPELCKGIIGGTEETTTGVQRLRAMAEDGKLRYPVIAINDAETKWDFDNVYGTGQSSLDAIMRATNVLLGGKVFVVAGFGHCGRGCAMRARGMGARVIVTEVKATAALKAALEGFEVMRMEDAAKIGDIFITATGMKDIMTGEHFTSLKDGAIVCNTGHYDCEINLSDLKKVSKKIREVRPNNEEYTLNNGNRVYVLAQGRLVNLAAAEGHPAEVMDMSFANQFLGMVKLAKEGAQMKPTVYTIDPAQDQEIARIKLESMGMKLDALSEEQIKYQTDYSAGT